MGGARKIALCRELTKRFEEVFPTTLAEAVEWYESHEPKGEYVLVLEGKSRQKAEEEARQKWEELSIPEHVESYVNQGLDKRCHETGCKGPWNGQTRCVSGAFGGIGDKQILESLKENNGTKEYIVQSMQEVDILYGISS